MKPAYGRPVKVWFALMALLALTCGSAFVDMGAWNGVANFSIAVLKALLVAAFFMHLISAQHVYRLIVLTALFTLTLLLGLSAADYWTRGLQASPWQVPRGAISSARAILNLGPVCRLA